MPSPTVIAPAWHWSDKLYAQSVALHAVIGATFMAIFILVPRCFALGSVGGLNGTFDLSFSSSKVRDKGSVLRCVATTLDASCEVR